MKVDRARIERLVPQAGAMCLLDGVTQWDASAIACSAAPPGDGHPLLRAGALPAVAGCEYAAQATAVHGGLLDDAASPRAGMLAKLMNVELHRSRFAPGDGAIGVRASLVSRTDGGCIYSFEVGQSDKRVASGRLMVAFGPPASS